MNFAASSSPLCPCRSGCACRHVAIDGGAGIICRGVTNGAITENALFQSRFYDASKGRPCAPCSAVADAKPLGLDASCVDRGVELSGSRPPAAVLIEPPRIVEGPESPLPGLRVFQSMVPESQIAAPCRGK